MIIISGGDKLSLALLYILLKGLCVWKLVYVWLDEEKVEENEGEVVAEQDSDSSATKLYFGNLPYSVDSAKLAGLIQDYGSAELIEVCM